VEILDDALLLISELVTNAVRHGSPPILLALECDGEGLRVRVRDGAPALPRPRDSIPEDEGGRGLALVDALSDAWGAEPVVDEHGGGKSVWFELRNP
jgi:anti-sigma regulatory factor (Ser/Thr protein kinase)